MTHLNMFIVYSPTTMSNQSRRQTQPHGETAGVEIRRMGVV